MWFQMAKKGFAVFCGLRYYFIVRRSLNDRPLFTICILLCYLHGYNAASLTVVTSERCALFYACACWPSGKSGVKSLSTFWPRSFISLPRCFLRIKQQSMIYLALKVSDLFKNYEVPLYV